LHCIALHCKPNESAQICVLGFLTANSQELNTLKK
jgi:hypothetical protein